MYPVLFTIPGLDFPVSTFGVMMAVGFLLSWWVVAKRMAEYDLDPELSSTILLYAMIGGVVGAKLYFAIDMTLQGRAEFVPALLDRAGMTWYGGLIGGTIAVTAGTFIHKVSTRLVAGCVALAAPFGQASGRVGCFLVGDDYGRATDAWYGIAFPQGAPPISTPVHPAQLYEVALLVPIGFFLWSRRNKSPFIFGEYLMLSAVARFCIEFVRINPRFGGLSEAQWIAIGLFVIGSALWVYYRGKPGEETLVPSAS